MMVPVELSMDVIAAFSFFELQWVSQIFAWFVTLLKVFIFELLGGELCLLVFNDFLSGYVLV